MNSIMAEKILVIQYGLEPIGRAMARLVVERSELALIGGVDIDPSKAGRDLGEFIGLDNALGFNVEETIRQVPGLKEAEVALHTTHSYFPQFKHQLLEILQAGKKLCIYL
jgi:4-hydroxy-tetrahydrodipicolinate reductase